MVSTIPPLPSLTRVVRTTFIAINNEYKDISNVICDILDGDTLNESSRIILSSLLQECRRCQRIMMSAPNFTMDDCELYIEHTITVNARLLVTTGIMLA